MSPESWAAVKDLYEAKKAEGNFRLEWGSARPRPRGARVLLAVAPARCWACRSCTASAFLTAPTSTHTHALHRFDG